MAEIEVRIFRKGKEIAKVLRPLRELNGRPAVKYRKQLWPLVNDGEVHLDATAPSADAGNQKTTGSSPTGAAPQFQVVPPALIEWDQSQRDVIDAPPQQRLLVGAGPGTGKTAVACARVSQLIDQDGLEPSRIWLISFTRTAVREIRDRIAAYLEDTAAAYAVKIATLDAHAWTIHSGFDDEAKILGSYEENIERVLELIQGDDNVAEYLEGIEHLVVDEAQDIVGVRADLVVGIIRRLAASCGVTVFADEAQAIYGFADDREAQAGHAKEPLLPEKLRRGDAGAFTQCELTKVHRTGSPQLLTIFSDTRRKVLTAAGDGIDRLTEVREDIIRLAHGEAPGIDDAALAELADAFILYRRRCDVLLTTSILTQNGIAHRVRMSGLPACLAPWIGVTLSEHTASDLGKEGFMQLWTGSVQGTHLASCSPDEAWAHLVRIAGRTRTVVDMKLLRQRLGRTQPPAELCQPELGHRGPIVGTIHASIHGQNVDQDEEARVVFVGATRGRSRLLIGRGYRQYAGRVEASGRAYCLQTRNDMPRAQVEIGRDGDISAEGLAGRRFFGSAGAVRISQTRIRSFAENTVSLVAETDRSAGFAYRLKEDGEAQCLAVLSQSVNADLFSIAKAIQGKIGGSKRRTPDTLRHLHVHGLRTIVLPPDSAETESLYEPWRTSGIVVAPVVLGYTTAFFPTVSKGRRW
ncbi:MAG: UvrD-helicase domain-containing protein [Rhodospirillales bacterium]|nr:MAG: UvrD-helicase domain-containing protein [Rhodospirillales bacterium]